MNFDAFSHGQVYSKLWLCEQLEPFIKEKSRVLILGSWYNILGFMLNCRKPNYYTEIRGLDIDPEATNVANKINGAWVIDNPTIFNETGDANYYEYQGYDVVINCSGEHFQSTKWFDRLPSNILVCIQSTNIVDENPPWLISQPTPDFNSFIQKYPLTNPLFANSKQIQYKNNTGYDRYMMIGYK